MDENNKRNLHDKYQTLSKKMKILLEDDEFMKSVIEKYLKLKEEKKGKADEGRYQRINAVYIKQDLKVIKKSTERLQHVWLCSSICKRH